MAEKAKNKKRASEDKRLRRRVFELERVIENMRVREAAQNMLSTKKLFWRNVLAGVARGVGTMLGFALLGALIGLILTTAIKDTLPAFARWLEQLLEKIQNRL
nr:DUF5665 domain-containing protein [bacterium]